jgi:diaminohydroxyphosphoribosylaminopyrimidine deaminase/5-amino-6-(5-phosphoribosylamino)uracil reductase
MAGGSFDIRACLSLLAKRGITRLLVEGGPSIWTSFFKAGIADEVVVFLAGHGGKPDLAVPRLDRFTPPRSLKLVRSRDLGPDRMFVLEPTA